MRHLAHIVGYDRHASRHIFGYFLGEAGLVLFNGRIERDQQSGSRTVKLQQIGVRHF